MSLQDGWNAKGKNLLVTVFLCCMIIGILLMCLLSKRDEEEKWTPKTFPTSSVTYIVICNFWYPSTVDSSLGINYLYSYMQLFWTMFWISNQGCAHKVLWRLCLASPELVDQWRYMAWACGRCRRKGNHHEFDLRQQNIPALFITVSWPQSFS